MELNQRDNAMIEEIVNRLIVVGTRADVAKVAVAKPLLNNDEAAKVLNVTAGTLHVWRSTGRQKIKFIRVGSKIRYRLSDLLEWLESQSEIPELKQKSRRKPSLKPRRGSAPRRARS
jgi:excisionase family DNA binding protein